MPESEGRIFSFENEEAIRADFLETLEYDGLPQEITCETGEFSAVCPFSGLPDLGRVTISYIPDGKIVELKSLKYYFVSFRNVGIYQEAATNRIYSDLARVLEPKYLSVETVYNTRGGIDARCFIDTPLAEGQDTGFHPGDGDVQ
jgi:7-cyano-7-deazaguanine reductase